MALERGKEIPGYIVRDQFEKMKQMILDFKMFDLNNECVLESSCVKTTSLNSEDSSEERIRENIQSLNKQLKHCQNPMERKRLSIELNHAYKKLKLLRGN